MRSATFFRTALALAAAGGLLAGCASAPKEAPREQAQLEAPQQPSGPTEEEKRAAARAAAAQAIADARAAVARAESVDGLQPGTSATLQAAERAFDAGDYERAKTLADQARAEAELGYNQALLEKAKALIEQAKVYEADMTPAQRQTLADAEAAVRQAQGERAYALASGLLAELRASVLRYTVVRGDSLWKISGREEVYGDPFRWPLIYKRNRDQIRDADLIYPGQVFTIDRFPSPDAVAAAVEHARNRGAWSLGEVEASDLDYLNRSP
ncbi:LysM peptidoglycan-binding domain-containing protein [Inmirania thermothiophila]|uniref:LysM domain-containing protein n=1 Tax=Inmirania thermothiophila TaxID=1750597 RepID=A0A3N1Y8E5_9GAMM|nr:LysM peptidoglycan-binding domain-containing protein [Inmirania thermothiophila]ROR35076.1 LysM domain-containing protein [Inmirania thermothiophila]